MNEELQNALTEILNSTIQATGDVKDFVMAEIPEVVQQLLMWKMAEGLVYFFASIAWFITLSFVVKWIYKKAIDHNEEGLFVMIAFVIAFGSIPGAVMANLVWLQIWIAPKVYLIEYAAELAK